MYFYLNGCDKLLINNQKHVYSCLCSLHALSTFMFYSTVLHVHCSTVVSVLFYAYLMLILRS
jgi:hypothetical protein